MSACTPQLSNTIVDVVADNDADGDQVVIPSTGLGGSEGPGTYVWYRELGVEKKLRFGTLKVPLHLKGKGKQKGK